LKAHEKGQANQNFSTFFCHAFFFVGLTTVFVDRFFWIKNRLGH